MKVILCDYEEVTGLGMVNRIFVNGATFREALKQSLEAYRWKDGKVPYDVDGALKFEIVTCKTVNVEGLLEND